MIEDDVFVAPGRHAHQRRHDGPPRPRLRAARRHAAAGLPGRRRRRADARAWRSARRRSWPRARWSPRDVPAAGGGDGRAGARRCARWATRTCWSGGGEARSAAGSRAGAATVALGVARRGAHGRRVVAVEVGRVWRRGSAPLPPRPTTPLQAAAEAVAETAEVAIVGYREVSTRENALFNLLASFVTTLHHRAQRSPRCCASAPRSGPFRNLQAWAGATSTTSCPGSCWRSAPAARRS